MSITEKINEEILAANLKHCRNGDPLGYLVESLAIKLQWSLQDITVLGLVTDDEIEAVKIERDNYFNSIKKEN